MSEQDGTEQHCGNCATDVGTSELKAQLGVWRDIEKDPPSLEAYDRWILVVNSAGFHAAVNELTENTREEGLSGWAVTAEQEDLVISDIKWWKEIPITPMERTRRFGAPNA